MIGNTYICETTIFLLNITPTSQTNKRPNTRYENEKIKTLIGSHTHTNAIRLLKPRNKAEEKEKKKSFNDENSVFIINNINKNKLFEPKNLIYKLYKGVE